MPRNTYSDDLKAKVLADRLLGMSLAQLAKKYDVPKPSVQRWVTERPIRPVSIPQKDDLGALVYEYLAAGLKALIAQAGVMGDSEWFKEQRDTSYLIHGTLADKLVIVFGGVERGSSEADDA